MSREDEERMLLEAVDQYAEWYHRKKLAELNKDAMKAIEERERMDQAREEIMRRVSRWSTSD
jgi:hypothetical protein